MQDAAARKMPADVDDFHSVPERLFVAIPEADVFAPVHDPLLVGSMDVDGAIERLGPVVHVAVVMRVRKTDRAQSASRLDELDGGLIQQGDAVPKDVSTLRHDEKGALPDREPRHDLHLIELLVQSIDAHRMLPPQYVLARPALPSDGNILPVVLADLAKLRCGAGRILRSAGDAYA